MALSYIEAVRLLMGDLDEGDHNFFTGDQWAHLFGMGSYDDEDGNSKVSLVEVAIAALRILSLYHADARPERSKKVDDRVAALSRWPNEQKALYLEDGVPDGIGVADAFRGPQGDQGVTGRQGRPGGSRGHWAAGRCRVSRARGCDRSDRANRANWPPGPLHRRHLQHRDHRDHACNAHGRHH